MIKERLLDPASIKHLTIAGWTGRDRNAVEEHIAELCALGVARPKTTPIYYRVASSLLTVGDKIEVLGESSSGEIEPVIFALDGELWVGVGSDHTDRKAETVGVSLSKQMCAKPVSQTLWRYNDIAAHWDDLRLISYVTVGTECRVYQDGFAKSLRPVEELIQLGFGAPTLPDGYAMFCGTFAVKGEITGGSSFRMELHDPVSGGSLSAEYEIHNLPVEG